MADGREPVLREIREDEVVELARDLVRIPSFTTEETPVARFLARYLEEQPMCYAGNDGSRLVAAGIPSCRYGPGDGITDPAARYHIARDSPSPSRT